MRLTLALAMLALTWLLPAVVPAQDDPDEAPLGDVARSLRKQTPPAPDVIDNDNISQVTDEVASHRLASAALLYSIDGAGRGFQVSAPDVTCSLSFSANAKALLSSQYAQLELPPNELLKLDGPAAIEGDSLQVSVFNGTDWHVSELAVAFTLVKHGDHDSVTSENPAKLIPAVAPAPVQELEVRSQRRSDTTVLYRMRAAAPPSSVTIFKAPLNIDVNSSQEWHWAIVQAKGYPPQRSPETVAPTQSALPQLLPQAQDSPGSSQPLPPQLSLEPHRDPSNH